jgi:DTW domain-containing protein YfiP
MTDKAGEKIAASKQGERASWGLITPVESMQNQVRVIVLQHPQEPDKELGTAALLARALDNAEVKVGLSWRSFKAIAGEDAVPADWAVLYLGAQGKSFLREVNFASKKGEPLTERFPVKGIVVLDGTWSQAKALWWRNAWLLKLKRIVIQPKNPSIYGRLRKEPRREAVSTLESAALALGDLDPNGEKIREHLLSSFRKMLQIYRDQKKNSPAKSP